MRTQNMNTLKMFEPREKLREEAVLESVYDEKGIEKLEEIRDDKERIE